MLTFLILWMSFLIVHTYYPDFPIESTRKWVVGIQAQRILTNFNDRIQPALIEQLSSYPQFQGLTYNASLQFNLGGWRARLTGFTCSVEGKYTFYAPPDVIEKLGRIL